MIKSPETNPISEEESSLLKRFDPKKLRLAATSTALALWLAACAGIDTANGITLNESTRDSDGTTQQADLANTSLTQEDIELLAATDDVEQIPTATPRPTTTSTARPTATARSATATPTPESVESTMIDREVTLAVLNGNTNLRAGAGTTFDIIATGKTGDTYEINTDEDGKLVVKAAGGYNWYQVKTGNPGTPFVWIASVGFTERKTVVEDYYGPNTGGEEPTATSAISSTQEVQLPPTATVTPEAPATSVESEAGEASYESVAKLIEPVEFGGNNPIGFVEGVTEQEASQLMNETYLAAIAYQTGLSLEEIKEIIENNGDVLLNIPAESHGGPVNRAPAVLGDPEIIRVVPAKGFELSYFSTEQGARDYIMSLGYSFDYRQGAQRIINGSGQVIGTAVCMSSSNTFRYYLVHEEKMIMVNGNTSGSARYFNPYQMMFYLAYASDLKDEIGPDGKPTYKITNASYAIGVNYKQTGENVLQIVAAQGSQSWPMPSGPLNLDFPEQLRPDDFYWTVPEHAPMAGEPGLAGQSSNGDWGTKVFK